MRITRTHGFVLLALAAVLLGGVWYATQRSRTSGTPAQRGEVFSAAASCAALRETIVKNEERFAALAERGLPVAGGPLPLAATQADGRGGEAAATAALDYSRTNVQVEGVDEADVVKTDGKYVYTLAGQRLVLIRAIPPDEAEVMSMVTFPQETNPQEFFLHDNHLVVFGSRNVVQRPVPLLNEGEEGSAGGEVPSVPDAETMVLPPFLSQPLTFVYVYDVSDRTAPVLVRSIEVEGSYLTSRMINDTIYFVLQSIPPVSILSGLRPLAPDAPEGAGLNDSSEGEEEELVPRLREAAGPLAEGAAFSPVVPCEGVVYPEPIVANQYLTVVGLPVDEPEAELVKKVVLGAGSTVYASPDRLYVAGVEYRFSPLPLRRVIPDVFPAGQPEEETIVYAFGLSRTAITYEGQGRVPGRVLNQFSMDEFGDVFRIATTVGETWMPAGEGRPSHNAVYVLNRNLERVGALEGLAPGETIYSARFMDKRAYLVTFKKIDPFFVIDLSDPRNPRLLGKLKIPGFSDYLHPYDDTHIIGVGKNAEDAPEQAFAWYQGMKLALFDVSDPEHPTEVAKVDIGDRGTDSPVLTDHRAFFFDPLRHVLALPILLAEIPDEKQSPEFEDAFLRGSQEGDFVFQGTYVYELTPRKGFVLKGRITHLDDPVEEFKKLGYDPGGSSLFVKRNLRIGESLYSLSDGKMLVHDLTDLMNIATVRW